MRNYLYQMFLPLAAIATIVFLASGVNYSTGSPGGKTGSPGDGFQNCTDCHLGSSSNADGLISTNIPSEGFLAGETYEISVTISDADAGRFGFELTAENEFAAKVGTFEIIDNASTQLVNSNEAVSHTFNGTSPEGNARTWTANWTAPENPDDNITFYAAVNVANGNGANTGDEIFTTSTTAQINDVGIGAPSLVKGLFPNPASDVVEIGLKKSDVHVKVYDMNGKLMDAFYTKKPSVSLDVSQYKTGIYFVQANNSKMEKLLVSRLSQR